MFATHPGFCEWDSPCNDGVCYYNSSGCPVMGYHYVNTSTNYNHADSDEAVKHTVLQGVDMLLLTVLSAVLLVALVTVLACKCRPWKAER